MSHGLVCDLACEFEDDLIEKFESILIESVDSMKIKDKKSWWNERLRLDKRLKVIIPIITYIIV